MYFLTTWMTNLIVMFWHIVINNGGIQKVQIMLSYNGKQGKNFFPK